MRVDEVKPLHIDDLIARLRKRGLKPRTQKLALNVLKPLYRFALVNQLADEDPTRFITIKIPPQKKIVINAGENCVSSTRASLLFSKTTHITRHFFFLALRVGAKARS
jgi:hypothetical protein